MTVIVTVDLPNLAEAAGVLGLASTPPALDSAAWRKLPAPAAALRVLDELGDARSGDEAIVVVRPPGRIGLHLVLQAMAAIVGRDRVVDVPLGRTPLTAAVSATFADVLAHELEVPLGLVPELMRAVERQVTIGALMPGVGHLETPQPRLHQQVAGYWPTTRALVRRGRSDRVRVVGKKHSAAALGRALAPADHRLVVSLPLSAPAWMRDVVSSRHDRSDVPVAVLTADPRTGAHWGVEKMVEAAGLPPRWRAVVRATIERLTERTCSWCAQQVNHVDACDLCSDSSLVTAARRGADRAGAPVSVRPAPRSSARASSEPVPAPVAAPEPEPEPAVVAAPAVARTTTRKAPKRAAASPKAGSKAGSAVLAPAQDPEGAAPPRRRATARRAPAGSGAATSSTSSGSTRPASTRSTGSTRSSSTDGAEAPEAPAGSGASGHDA